MARTPAARTINRRYHLEALLGEGSMGAVYRARDALRPGRDLALKLLAPQPGRQDLRERLRAEFHTLTRLRHPNLVTVHDLGIDRDTSRWFLTMEFVQGQTLAGWKPGQRPGLLDLVVPLLRALDFVHGRGFVHADIKPENILLPADGGEPKIVDFGLAGVIGGPAAVRGTLPYTAPEILRGDSPGPRSDLYSLGATMYRAAAGHGPFDAPRPDEVIEGHLRREPPFSEALLAVLPPGLHAVLRRLLAKNPEHRPASGAEVISTLNDLAGTRYPVDTSETRSAQVKRGELVGRAEELRQLESLLAALGSDGKGQSAIILGAAGMGKTRMVEELRTAAQMEGCAVLTGASRDGADNPYEAIGTVLRDLVPISPSPPAAAITHLVPELGDASEAPDLDRTLLAEAAAEMIRAAAQVIPLVVILEDQHHSGPDQARMLSHLLRGTREARVMWAITGRPDQPPGPFPTLMEEMSSELPGLVLELLPLSQEDAGRLAASLLGGGTADEDMLADLAAESGGNPYLLGETVQALIDSGALARQTGGQWQLDATDLAPGRSSPSLDEAASRHLQALTPEELSLVRILAVSGDAMDGTALQRLAGMTGREVQIHTERLVDRDLLRLVEAPGKELLRLAHDFVREGVYRRLRDEDAEALRQIHDRIAHDLAAHAGERIDDVAAQLASHFRAAGQMQEAARFHLRAAGREERRFALEAASSHLRQALEILSESDQELTAATWERLGEIQRQDIRPRDAEIAFCHALEIPGRPAGTRARLLWRRSLAMNVAGEFDTARRLASDALEIYAGLDDAAGAAACENAIGVSYARSGEHQLAEHHYRRALERRRGLGSRADIAASLNNLGMVLFFQGRADDGQRCLEEALDLSRACGDTRYATHVQANLGLLARGEGRLADARRHLEEAERSYNDAGSLRLRAQCLVNLAEVTVRLGAYHLAAAAAAEAADLDTRLGLPSEVANALQILGDAHRESGRMEPAAEAHERGLALARRAGDASQEGFCLAALALDHLAAGDAATASRVIEEATALEPAGRGERLFRRLQRARVVAALAIGHPESAARELDVLEHLKSGTGDAQEVLEIGLLRARTHMLTGNFDEASTQLQALLDPLRLAAHPAREWEILRLAAQSASGQDHPDEAAELRRRAAEALVRLTAALPGEFRAALEATPAAVRLRIDTGGSELSRVSASRFLDTMYAVIEALTSSADMDGMLEEVMDLALELLGAERGMILLFPEDGGRPRVATARNVEEETIADAISYSCRVVEQGRLGRSLVAADAATDPRLQEFTSVSLYHIRSVICVPMRSRQRIIGTVYLDSRARTIGFDDEDLRFLEAFAQHAAIAMENASMMRALEKENLTLRKTLLERYSFANIVGRSPVMLEVFSNLKTFTSTALPVLIHGESGTGKELVARALHYNGPRKDRSFLVENCAALPEPLLESQLFGHVRGAFTGAAVEQRGLFQEADGGTLFLDEIGEMSAALQARLTRVLETGEFRPVGGSQTLRTDVRIVAATHRDLEDMVQRGQFRRDLLYRLNVITVELPPLRERREDIELLVSHFLGELSREMSIDPPGIEDDALENLSRRDWPGNVRQLRNELSRLLVFRRGDVITAEDVRDAASMAVPMAPDYVEESSEVIPLKELERRHILRALEETKGDRTRAARLLRVGRATVFRKIKDYDLDA